MGELACRGLADSDQLFQTRMLLHCQGNFVLGHGGTPSLEGRTVASMVQRASSTPVINRNLSAYYGATLWIGIRDHDRAIASLLGGDGEMHGRGRFAGAAFLIGNDDD